MKRITFEVCVASVDDAIIAEQGGADRIELNSALELGGLTPTLGRLQQVKSAINIPIAVMLRPRHAGFAYSDAEFQEILTDAAIFNEIGVDAFVIGLLQPDGTLDSKRIRQLQQAIGSTPLVCSRAFDVVPDPFDALEQLIDLGFRRVMTSGQQSTAIIGQELITRLIDHSKERIEILPAGGLRPENIQPFVRVTRCQQVHASLRKSWRDSSTQHRPDIRFGSTSTDEQIYRQTDLYLVQTMRATLDQLTRSPEAG